MNATAPGSGEGPSRQRMLSIYLNDHLAGATTGAELARRMVQEHGDSACGDDLKHLAAEISQDRKALLRLLADLDVPVKRYKVYGAWLGEKVGRVKPNGRVLRRSALTVLVELEAMRLGVQGKALLWRVLLDAAVHDSRLDHDWLEQLLQRARQQIMTLDSLHDRAASALLTPTVAPAATSEAVPGKDTPT
ncbi:hypothetical protein ACFTY8_40560 [Streptomyces mirabilis]|uniref:hypothetical protein n=1 Tax=Streptomyces mirabilis TaxID=68239 RepID=UPI00362C7492